MDLKPLPPSAPIQQQRLDPVFRHPRHSDCVTEKVRKLGQRAAILDNAATAASRIVEFSRITRV